MTASRTAALLPLVVNGTRVDPRRPDIAALLKRTAETVASAHPVSRRQAIINRAAAVIALADAQARPNVGTFDRIRRTEAITLAKGRLAIAHIDLKLATRHG